LFDSRISNLDTDRIEFSGVSKDESLIKDESLLGVVNLRKNSEARRTLCGVSERKVRTLVTPRPIKLVLNVRGASCT